MQPAPLTISRSEYDVLVKLYPDYMMNKWPLLQKNWSVSGIHVSFRNWYEQDELYRKLIIAKVRG